MDADDLKRAVQAAATRPEVCAAVQRVYADLQREIDARRPTCATSGRCCHFDEYGHRLYVTTLELAAFVSALATQPAQAPSSPLHILTQSPGGCPFQTDRLCGVHPIRPFGCRIFFCDPSATAWQNEQYEAFHARLKQLHDELGVPYFYVEWRQGLRAVQRAQISGARLV